MVFEERLLTRMTAKLHNEELRNDYDDDDPDKDSAWER